MKTIICFVCLLSFELFSQYSLLGYSEIGNTIKLKIKLEACVVPPNLAQRCFIDESRPGEYALPSKEICIGIPSGSIATNISIIRLQENILKVYPIFNPKVVRISDSTKIYNFNAKAPSAQKEILKIKGYLFIENINSIHLELNQYRFNELTRFLSEITEIEIMLTLNKLISDPVEAAQITKKYKTADIIINKEYAGRFKQNVQIIRSDKASEWFDYSKDYIKIKTVRNDIYRITYECLEKFNINPALINPNTFNIYGNGKKLSVYISGEANGLFEPGEYIEFWGTGKLGGQHRETSDYGKGYNEYFGIYSDTSVFWLTWGDSDPKRVTITDGVISGIHDTLKYYTSTIHFEQNNWFDFSVEDIIRRELPFRIENKTWGWTSIGVGNKSFNFNATDVYPGKTFKLYAKLQSYASDLNEYSHQTAIGFNDDAAVYDLSFIHKYQQKVHEIQLSSDSILNGVNRFKLFSFPTSSGINSIFFDWFEIEYPRYLRLNQDSIYFSFSSLKPAQLKSLLIDNATSGNYSIWRSGILNEKYLNYYVSNSILCFTDTISEDDVFVVKAENCVKGPKLEPPKQFINLRDSTRSADYILITSDYFYEKGIKYAEFIEQNYGVDAVVINVVDIYDEFAYGEFNPESIKDFLLYAGHFWKKPFPKYLFLVGDCTYDYHNNKHKFQGAPTKINIVPSFGAPVSDNWFIINDTTGACIPEMNIGRLPVNSFEEFDHYWDKHRIYLTKGYDEWNKNYLFFSGGPGNDIQQLEQLKRVQDSIITQIISPFPIGGGSKHFYKTIDPVTNFGPYSNEDFQNAIDSSGILISYLGHSGTQTWDNGIVDPVQLQSKLNVSPLITDFGCSTGKFAEPDIVSFSELFTLAPNGEAMAYIGNSSLGFISTSTIYPHIFLKKMLIDSIYCISEAHKLAKLEMMQTFGSTGIYKLFALTNIFFGDPIVRLNIPKKPNLIASNIFLNKATPSDNEDSIQVTLTYLNSGKAADNFFQLHILDELNSILVVDSLLNIPIPLFRGELQFSIPILNKAGKHTLKVNLDPNNEIEESNEYDNTLSIDYYVQSASIRLMTDYNYESSKEDTIIFLNPISLKDSSLLEIDVSQYEDFHDQNRFIIAPDTFMTVLDLSNYIKGRKWIRGKLQGKNAFSFNSSLIVGEEYNYLANDNAAFDKMDLNNLSTRENTITLDTSIISFRIISAGLHDGKTAVITKNCENYVPMGNVIGHHICLFNAETYEFVTYKKFNLFGEGPEAVASYYNFLDTLDDHYLVMIAIADEGRVTVDSLVTKIKEFGSIYIDSLGFRSSWAFIGRLGMPQGSMPELYHKAFTGRVQLDTLVHFVNTTGMFTTPLIGPAVKWEKLKFEKHTPLGTSVRVRILGIIDGITDTLDYFSHDSSITSLFNIPYKYIKLNGCLNTENDSIPHLTTIGIKYISPAELGTNYQGLTVSDSLEAGEINTLSFYVTNAGDSPADSFNVQVEVTNQINKEIIYSGFIDYLGPKEKRIVNCSYTASGGAGPWIFNITIDPENGIFEKYKDNNYLTVPFYVFKDTTAPILKVRFDGNEILSGDYVPAAPEILFDLYDSSPLPISDPAALIIYLDERQLVYSIPSDTLFYEFNSGPGIRVRVTYKPSLSSGIHKLKIYARDASGNFYDSSGTEILFYVADQVKVLQVYNYPDPFTDNTYFTFRLTQIPDDLHINIYTAAGRMIRKIYANKNTLKYDFNTIPWDGTDEDGDPVSSGVYFYKITINKNGETESVIQKMARVR